ncbi:MAG: glycosyltransferase [Candidatus Falkowbacteria bacterium]|nr:MAG: glycosyltransferase [Candidatus Falkowbacteria bacterium]
MKLLQINKLYYPIIGGIETVVKDIAEGLNGKDDLNVDVLACQKKGARKTETISGVKVFKAASLGKALGMPLSIDFFRLFKKLVPDYDLFLVHYPFPLAALIAPFIPKEKLIIYYHSDIVRQKLLGLLFRPFIGTSLKRAQKILVSGQNIISSSPLLKKYAAKCTVIPFGFKANFQDADYQTAEKIKQQYGADRPLLLAIGRLVYYKGYQYAIEALKNIEARFLIIGQGPEEQKLRAQIKDTKQIDKIFIIPPQARLEPYLLACDIFLFPSTARSEAFGLVQLEALAAGKPIINTHLNTAAEEVSLDGVSGLTVEPKNAETLASAITKLLDNEALRQQYGENARRRYQKLFQQETFLKKISQIIISSNSTKI